MSERKVLNKYFPPDFDPALIPRRKMPKDLQHKVRLMTPFSMRCGTCGEYIYKGKKFNARKETVEGETYLNILIFRFYIRCPRCAAEITFKTDPKNGDYVADKGATRNFEPWRDEDEINEIIKQERENEEENNPMKALENRTLDSKRELEISEGLDEIRARNAKIERLDLESVLELDKEAKFEKEADDLAKSVFQSRKEQEAKEDLVKVLSVEEVKEQFKQTEEKPVWSTNKIAEKKSNIIKSKLGIIVTKPTKTVAKVQSVNPATKLIEKKVQSKVGLDIDYSDSSDDK